MSEQAEAAGPPPDDESQLCLADVERLAARHMPAAVRDFVNGGSGDELTLGLNRAALDSLTVVPRVLAGNADCDLNAKLVRSTASAPLAVAPMAYHRLVHPGGEVEMARAARTAGVPFAVSMLSSCPLEDIAAVGGCLWFQLYWLRDRGRMRELIRLAERNNCEALVLTVDAPVMGRRLRDIRNAFTLPPEVTGAILDPDRPSEAHERTDGMSAVAAHTSTMFDPAVGWADVSWVRAQTRLPLVLKGILDPEDACRAAAAGADAVVVSNHGGRQLDGAVAAVSALPSVVEALAGRCQVLFDSGVRSGRDVLKALALGASGVLVGRPLLWGLAADGHRGALRVLELLRLELSDALRLSGCAGVARARRLTVLPTFPSYAVAPNGVR